MPRDKTEAMTPSRVLARAILIVLLGAAVARAETLSACASVPQAIPDDGTTLVVPIGVSETGTVDSVTVDLDIAHPFTGDLTITLTNGATTVTLMSRVGSGTWSFGCGGDDVLATFSDGATSTPADLCVPGAPAPMISGVVLPEEALGAFAGLEAGGTWELRITDEAAFDAGTLGGACLTIQATPPAGCVGDLDGDGDTDVFDFGLFAPAFGTSVGEPGYVPAADLDGNETIDVFDFGLFAPDFGCTP